MLVGRFVKVRLSLTWERRFDAVVSGKDMLGFVRSCAETE